jgi:hypothetical protein
MLKHKRYLILLLLTMGVALFAVGCGKEDEDDGSAVTDEQALEQMVLNDSELEDVNSYSGDADDSLDGGGGKLDEAIIPIFWGRIGHLRRQQILVEFQGDTLATITRTNTFNGVFRVVALGDSGGGWVTYNKPMYNTSVRKIHAVRIDRTPYPARNWRITEVTPEVLSSADSIAHTIWPIRVDVFRETDEGPVLVTSVTDPLNTWLNRESLPTMDTQSDLTFYVTANDTSAAIGVLHPRVFRVRPHPRLSLRDDGNLPDLTEGDGIYSGQYTVGTVPGVFFSAFDLIDYETIYDSALPYNAGAWSIPYRVVVPQ